MAKAKILPHNTEEFKGYTLEEMRYMRAYEAAKVEIARERLLQNFHQMKESTFALKDGLLGKILGSFSYLEIGMLAYKAGKRLYKFFKKRK